MRNQYGQTDILARYLAQQPQQHHTPLGTALRLGGAGIAALGDYKRREGQKTALVDALRGLNTPGANGPTMAAAASAPVQDPEGMAALLSNPNTAPIAQGLLAKAMNPPKPEAYTLGPGQTRFVGDQQLASVPALPKSRSPRDEAFAALSPEEQRQVLLRPSTQVTVGAPAQQTAEDKAYGGLLVENYGEVQDAANAARTQRGFLNQARALNDDALPSTFRQSAGNVLAALGINPSSIPGFEGITNGQQFNGIIGNAVLAKLQSQKGPQTENDARRIEQTVASLGNTPEARTFLLDSASAMAEMDILREQHWREHKARTGSFDGASASWDSGLGGQRIVRRHRATGDMTFLPQFIREAKIEFGAETPMKQILELWADAYE